MKTTDEPVGIVPGIAGRARALGIIATLGLITPSLMVLQWLFLRFWPKGARQLPHHYHRLVARIIGMRITVQGTRPEPGPCLIAANHCSWLDIVALSAVAPLSFIAKSEVAAWPLFGTFARLQRTVFVDRQRRVKVTSSRDEIRERLAGGERLVLFPEGTSTDGMRVLPFKSALLGAAETVVDGRPVPVQPLTIVYTGYRGVLMDRWLRPAYTWYGDMELAPHLWRVLQLGPFEVTVELHEPLTLAAVGSRKALACKAEQKVRAGLIKALTGHDRPERSRSGLDVQPTAVEMEQANNAMPAAS
ncbi:lysophospholipid acyltransferase family protein [Rhodoligotrophos defluvii]|uniref:lysophospholipid acyltransferase family protein n=1 Tax=Rhodoligotrophos defluvii TaxID=2561934 RepID=UPI0010C94B8B|nr:lysophospholipid acyltransferase family protein [Rhodoligotrophos defluvii]